MQPQGALLRRYVRRSLGTRAALLRLRHMVAKLKRIGVAVAAILLAAAVAGLALDGIGTTGAMIAGLAVIVAVLVLAIYPRFRMPGRESLGSGDLRSVVGRTELWLETQCQFLPRPLGQMVDRIGDQLDAMALQLEHVPEAHPKAHEVRRLVGRDLPEVISSYTSIPASLRGQKSGGRTPDEQLGESLGRISREIDVLTGELAGTAIDDLAVRTRYLDYKYGDAIQEPGSAPR